MNKSVVAFAVAIALAPALPAAAADSSPGLAACGDITDSQARLACFDRELAKSRSAPGAASAAPAAGAQIAPAGASPAPIAAPAAAAAPGAAAAAVTPPPAAATPAAPAAATPATPSATQSFGGENVASAKTESEDQRVMHARLTSQKELGSTRTFNLFLDNGQVWRHEDAPLGAYLRDGDAITITKHSMGVYRLTKDGAKSKNWIKVRRVR